MNEIAQIVQCSNGIVMVFDKKGEQMPEYQGKRKEVIKKLQGIDLSNVEFFIGSFGKGTVPMSKEQFFSEAWS